MNRSDTVYKLDSGSSLGDVNVDWFVILFLYPGCSILAADCDIFLQHRVKTNNASWSMNFHMNSGNGVSNNTIAFGFLFIKKALKKKDLFPS